MVTPSEAWDEGNYAYIRIDIPKDVELNITEMGLLDSSNNILFLSQCEGLYKSDKTTMNIFYKILKG
jgi:hypothetical protein